MLLTQKASLMPPIDLTAYLGDTAIINHTHPAIRAIATRIQANHPDDISRTKAAFELVRDTISHSFDSNAGDVTCTALEVLEAGHGICYAKSHLLAALLRAMDIPAGICYQTLADDANPGKTFLHALNAAYISSLKRWIRFDARGNKEGINAQFSLEAEQLAFPVRADSGEKDHPAIHAEPLPAVLEALTTNKDGVKLRTNLPSDIK